MATSSFRIFCRTCGESSPATKKHGPLPRTKRCAWSWWNVCLVCDTHYPGLPPGGGGRMRTRSYERASGQAELFR